MIFTIQGFKDNELFPVLSKQESISDNFTDISETTGSIIASAVKCEADTILIRISKK